MKVMENQKKNVVIVGASGGIGSGFLSRYLEDQSVGHIFTLSRSKLDDAFQESERLTTLECNIENEKSIADAVANITAPLHRVIVATGILHTDKVDPEKSLSDIDKENFEKIFAVNTHAVALLMKYLLPKLDKENPSVFAALSARVGSISDNHIGGWYAYRASKAALNMLIKTASIELKRKNDNAAIIALHPGTVDTQLSKPFQNYVKEGHLFTVEHATSKMKDVIEKTQASDTGKIFDYAGDEIQP